MRQIGDQLRYNPDYVPDMKEVNNALRERNELNQAEKDDIARFGKTSFKLMVSRICNDSCTTKNDGEYVKCFNACNIKMLTMKKMYVGVAKEFNERMEAYDKTNTNPFL